MIITVRRTLKNWGRKCENFDEDHEDVMHEEPEEDFVVKMYEESDEDPAEVIYKNPEENPDLENDEECDQDQEDVVYEEEEENPEESEDDSEEEISENYVVEYNTGSDSESLKHECGLENINLLSRNCSGVVEEIIVIERKNNMVDENNSEPISRIVSPSESHQNKNTNKHDEEINAYHSKQSVSTRSSKADNQFEGTSVNKFGIGVKIKSDILAVRKFNTEIGHSKVFVDGDCTSEQQEPGRVSRKRRHSRWDLSPFGKTALVDGSNKGRKTRWDNGGSQDLFQSFGVLNSIESLADPKATKMKRFIKISEMLQISNSCSGTPTKEKMPPNPDCKNHGIKISGEKGKTC